MTAFFGVIARPRTYLNILYLLLGLPLGTAYFVWLVTGISLGGGLIVLALVGLLILTIVLLSVRYLVNFEAWLAREMLGADVPASPALPRVSGNWWVRLKAILNDPVTWKGLLYLFVRFPVGIATFTVSVVLLSVFGGGATLWIYYRWVDYEIGSWQIDSAGESLIFLVPGILGFFASLHLLNLLARACGELARVMLATPPNSGQT